MIRLAQIDTRIRTSFLVKPVEMGRAFNSDLVVDLVDPADLEPATR